MSIFTDAELLFRTAIDKNTTPAELDRVIDWPTDALSVLFGATDQVRRHFFGNRVSPCAIMNIKSGGCTEDCAFCSQSSHNSADVTVQALSDETAITEQFHAARASGLHFGVVSSGRRLSAAEIRRLAGALARCDGPTHASLGMLGDEELRILREAGVVCYNHNLETSRAFFPRIVTTHTYEQRIETVRRIKAAGMHVCCGGIFGLGESWEDRRDLCLQLRELEVDTVPLNFFNPIEGTRPRAPRESVLDFLRIIALFRIGLPDTIVKVCGGRELHLRRHQNLIFRAGANGYISGDYLTTSGDPVASDNGLIADLGLVKEDA